MATLVGTQKDLGSLLNNLIELDYDAVAAYTAAIESLESPIFRDKLRAFKADHERHIIDLKPYAARYSEHVASGPDLKQVVTRGKVAFAQLAGDRAILYAMRSNEDDTNTAYDRAVRHMDVPGDLLALLQRNLSDERRHRAWLDGRIHRTQEVDLAEAFSEFDAPPLDEVQPHM